MTLAPVTVARTMSSILTPPAAGEVNPRFNGKDHPGLNHRFAARRHGGSFMNLEADAMAQAVAEIVAEAGRDNQLAGNPIDLDQRHTRCNRGQRLVVGGQHDFEDSPHFRRGLAHGDGNGFIGMIAVDATAEIDGYQFIGQQLPTTGHTVRQRPSGARTQR